MDSRIKFYNDVPDLDIDMTGDFPAVVYGPARLSFVTRMVTGYGLAHPTTRLPSICIRPRVRDGCGRSCRPSLVRMWAPVEIQSAESSCQGDKAATTGDIYYQVVPWACDQQGKAHGEDTCYLHGQSAWPAIMVG